MRHATRYAASPTHAGHGGQSKQVNSADLSADPIAGDAIATPRRAHNSARQKAHADVVRIGLPALCDEPLPTSPPVALRLRVLMPDPDFHAVTIEMPKHWDPEIQGDLPPPLPEVPRLHARATAMTDAATCATQCASFR